MTAHILTGEQRQLTASQARELYESGLSIARVGERLALNTSMARALLREAGTTMRSSLSGRRFRVDTPELAEQRTAWRTRYDAGESIYQIAQTAEDCTTNFVYSQLQLAATVFRSPGRQRRTPVQ